MTTLAIPNLPSCDAAPREAAREAAPRTYRLHRKPPALPLIGDLLHVRKNHAAFLARLARTGADIVDVDLADRRLFVIFDPEAVREVLVADTEKYVREGNLETAAIRAFLGTGMLTTDGEAWLKWKRLNAPAFTRPAVQGMQALIDDSIDRSLAVFPRARARRPLFEDFVRLAVTATTAGFLSVRPEAEDQDALVASMLGGPELIFAMARNRAPWLQRLPLPLPIRVRRASAAVERLLARNAARRRAESAAGKTATADLLDLVLQYRDPRSGALLSDAEVRDQLMTAVIAAPENIATTLSWASLELAQNPRVLARLREELARGDGPTLRAVVDETMRRHAPTPMIDRTAAVDVELGGVRIPRGSLVMIPIAAIHNHPRYWDAPEAFRPERFLDTPAPRAFFPFGHGPRKCIGERLARAVIESALRRFVMEFDWSRPSPAEPGYTPLISLRPTDRMDMWIERRGADSQRRRVTD